MERIPIFSARKTEGMRNEDIASKLDIGLGVVTRCLSKFRDNGVEAAIHDNKDISEEEICDMYKKLKI